MSYSTLLNIQQNRVTWFRRVTIDIQLAEIKWDIYFLLALVVRVDVRVGLRASGAKAFLVGADAARVVLDLLHFSTGARLPSVLVLLGDVNTLSSSLVYEKYI